MTTGFFTEGVDYVLPHPKIPARTLRLLCTVIKEAWRLLRKRPPPGFTLQSADEDSTTQMLVEIIENRIRKNGEIPGFDPALFGRVSREPKISNVNKKHPDKMPDIFFDLKRERYPILSDQDGLFVECKPVDQNHPIFSCYCKKGLARFVAGDYAWAMEEALMVGYSKAPYGLDQLVDAIDGKKDLPIINGAGRPTIDEQGICQSIHNRSFDWPENRGNPPPITLSHLWLEGR